MKGRGIAPNSRKGRREAAAGGRLTVGRRFAGRLPAAGAGARPGTSKGVRKGPSKRTAGLRFYMKKKGPEGPFCHLIFDRFDSLQGIGRLGLRYYW